jgi:MFS family permease
MAVAGLGNSVTQLASNHLLAQQVQSGRQGVAYGIKQSAIPIASMLAGLALPVLGLTLGWRATFLLGALGVIPVALLLRRLHQGQRRARGPRAGDVPVGTLALLSLGSGLGAVASSGLTTFTVVSAVEHGFAPEAAGLLLTAGSVFGIAARILSGWLADRTGHGSLLLASGLLGGGVIGYLGLAVAGPEWLVVLATLVAFAGGWGWPGLVLLATARTNPRAPATAMAITRIGPAFGNIVGPIVFGAVAAGAGYSLAWLISAAVAVLASMLIVVARGRLVGHRTAAAKE